MPDTVDSDQKAPLAVRLAAGLHTLDHLLTSFASDPQHAPSTAILRQTAKEMLAEGNQAAARQILESAFTREIDDHQLNAANMLGLAEIRIATKEMQGAVD